VVLTSFFCCLPTSDRFSTEVKLWGKTIKNWFALGVFFAYILRNVINVLVNVYNFLYNFIINLIFQNSKSSKWWPSKSFFFFTFLSAKQFHTKTYSRIIMKYKWNDLLVIKLFSETTVGVVIFFMPRWRFSRWAD